jgi:hypothetical protein
MISWLMGHMKDGGGDIELFLFSKLDGGSDLLSIFATGMGFCQ